MKWGLKEGIEIAADSDFPRYVRTLMLRWYLSRLFKNLFRLALAILWYTFRKPFYNQKAELAQLRANNTKGLLM